MERREFLQSGLAAGAVLLAQQTSAQPKPAADGLNLAMIGAGSQGRVLLGAMLPIPGIRVRAVCDVWPYRRRSAVAFLKTYGHEVREYADYREMLSEQKDLQAAIIATPDFVHAEQATACLQAGLHVYCESPMSNTLEQARAMAKAAGQTGKLLQIGYQRRSNARYLHVAERLLKEAQLLGQLTRVSTQWNQGLMDELGWPRRVTLPDEELKKYGYASMHEFRNWTWFKKYSAGPFAGFAAHQLDVAMWFLGIAPRSVVATGGLDFYRDRQCYDNVLAVYEFPTSEGLLRVSSQVLTTSSGPAVGNHELFLGVDGSIRISENPKFTKAFREPRATEWDQWVRRKYVVKASPAVPEKAVSEKQETGAAKPADPNEVRVQETGEVTAYDIPVVLDKPAYQPHLENFLDAVRGKAKLACPADVALRTEVAVLKALEAAEGRKFLALTPEEFRVG